VLWITSDAGVQAAGVSFHLGTLPGTVLLLCFWFVKAATMEGPCCQRSSQPWSCLENHTQQECCTKLKREVIATSGHQGHFLGGEDVVFVISD